jgi:hypothetical protein
MDIFQVLVLVTIAYLVLYGVILVQNFGLYRMVGSTSYLIVSLGWLGLALVQVWRILRIPIYLLREQARGGIPESLTIEQWLTLGLPAIPLLIFIVGLDKRRRDFDATGL